MGSSLWISSCFFSLLSNQTSDVVIKNTIAQKNKNPGSVTTPPFSGVERKYWLQKSGELRARNTTLPKKYPAVCPTVLQVDAQPTFRLESMVSAHPSTAMSWVAVKTFIIKNMAVRVKMSGEELSSPIQLFTFWNFKRYCQDLFKHNSTTLPACT